MIKYIEMDTFVSNNCIDIKGIDVFSEFVVENGIKTIFYGERTARNTIGKCFLFVLDSIFYVFTYQSKYGTYKNIDDYNNGSKNGFEDALEYYFSKTKEIKNYLDFHKYLLDEYLINDMDIKNYEINHDHDKNTYYLNFFKVIEKIEDIRKKHDFNTKECIACYNIINNIKRDGSYTINELYNICEYDITIIKYGPNISVDFDRQFEKYVEKSNDLYNEKTGKWEFDPDAFKIFIEKMLKILNINIQYRNEEDDYY